MNTFDFTDEEIIGCIIEVSKSLEGEEQEKIVKILVDFMQFKNQVKNNNIFVKDYQK